jgi:hypothetical protein
MMAPVVDPRNPENADPYGLALPQPRPQSIPAPPPPWPREDPPSRVLALWQIKLRDEDRDYRQRYDAAIPRSFWEKLRSCRPLTELCERSERSEPSEPLHAAIGLLEWFHRREAGFGTGPRGPSSDTAARKKRRRYWDKQARSAGRALAAIAALDPCLLPGRASQTSGAALRKALQKARRFAKNPPAPAVRIEITAGQIRVVTDASRLVVAPVSRKGLSRQRHIGSVKALVDLEIALLDEFLPPSTDRKRWVRLLSLLQHFNPKVFARIGVTPDRLRQRVQWFRREHAKIFDRHRKLALAGARGLLAHSSQ